MPKDHSKDPADILSFNRELMNLDFEDVSAEELERRLELQVAFGPTWDAGCSGNSCSTFWGNGTCTGNSCGIFHITPPPPV